MEEDYIYEEAKRIVKKKKGFYTHLGVYLAINTIFFFVVFINEGSFGWLIPASFWGIAIVIHYIAIFGFPVKGGVGGADWEAREIQKEMDKMRYPNEVDELELRELEKKKAADPDQDYV